MPLASSENPSLSPRFSFALWLPFSAGSIYLQFLVSHLLKSAGDWIAAQQWYLHSIVPIFWLLFYFYKFFGLFLRFTGDLEGDTTLPDFRILRWAPWYFMLPQCLEQWLIRLSNFIQRNQYPSALERTAWKLELMLGVQQRTAKLWLENISALSSQSQDLWIFGIVNFSNSPTFEVMTWILEEGAREVGKHALAVTSRLCTHILYAIQLDPCPWLELLDHLQPHP